MNTKRCLLYFVKWPEPGLVKTRLSMDIGNQYAAEIYRCFILDMLESLQSDAYTLKICFTPADSASDFRSWLGPKYLWLKQTGSDLGSRMHHAFEQSFRQDFESVCLIGSDLPGLFPEYILEAFAHLDHYDTVIGPAQDGGYYLIGFKRKSYFTEIFQDMSWSHPDVFRETIRRLECYRKTFYTLADRVDIDTVADLQIWYELYDQQANLAPRTRAFAEKLFNP